MPGALSGIVQTGFRLKLICVLIICASAGKTAALNQKQDLFYSPHETDDEYHYEDPDVTPFPMFDIPMANVTVVEGQTALLPCSVDHLGSYKVAWLGSKFRQLTLGDESVVDDQRFSLFRLHPKEWNLRIRDVQLADAGKYRCTVRNEIVLSKVVTLNVQVPAAIADGESMETVTLAEGNTLVLECNATGIPKPQVTWRRLHTRDSKQCSALSADDSMFVGRRLTVRNISRNCSDDYECAADNGVRAIATRTTQVIVEFAPRVELLNRRLSQMPGKETILDCRVTARPQVSSYWVKGPGDQALHAYSSRHSVEIYEDSGPHSVIVSLKINELKQDDYGEYHCVAINPLGRDQKTMTLLEFKQLTSTTRQTTKGKTVRTTLRPTTATIGVVYGDVRHSLSGTPSQTKFPLYFLIFTVANTFGNLHHAIVEQGRQ